MQITENKNNWGNPKSEKWNWVVNKHIKIIRKQKLIKILQLHTHERTLV